MQCNLRIIKLDTWDKCKTKEQTDGPIDPEINMLKQCNGYVNGHGQGQMQLFDMALFNLWNSTTNTYINRIRKQTDRPTCLYSPNSNRWNNGELKPRWKTIYFTSVGERERIIRALSCCNLFAYSRYYFVNKKN